MRPMLQKQKLEEALKLLEKPLSPGMLTMAWYLARHFGHEWGLRMETPPKGCMSINEIEDMTYDPENLYIGQPIFGPTLENGRLTHTSTTGRFTWQIASHGLEGAQCFLDINRPGLPGVISAVITYDGTNTAAPFSCHIYHVESEHVEARHVQALSEALRAFGLDLQESPGYETLPR